MENKPIYVVVHCSATKEDKDFTEKQINEAHVAVSYTHLTLPTKLEV